jgi:YVTN family beta-propeller protein
MSNIRRILMTSCIALALAPFSASAETALVYVTNSAGDDIDVINPLTNKVVQSFPIVGAHGVNFSPDGSRVYVSNEATSTLDVFEQKTGKLMKKITLSNHPNNIAVAKDGRIVVGIARGEGALDIIDPVKLEVVKTIPTHGRLHNCRADRRIHRLRSEDPDHRLGAQIRSWRAADDHRAQSGWLTEARIRPNGRL